MAEDKSGPSISSEQTRIEEFLNSPYNGCDGNYSSWRHYIADLLMTLHSEGEGFSGKRPLGNSGWKIDVAVGMRTMDPSVASVDPDGFAEVVDHDLADKLFRKVVNHVFTIK